MDRERRLCLKPLRSKGEGRKGGGKGVNTLMEGSFARPYGNLIQEKLLYIHTHTPGITHLELPSNMEDKTSAGYLSPPNKISSARKGLHQPVYCQHYWLLSTNWQWGCIAEDSTYITHWTQGSPAGACLGTLSRLTSMYGTRSYSACYQSRKADTNPAMNSAICADGLPERYTGAVMAESRGVTKHYPIGIK